MPRACNSKRFHIGSILSSVFVDKNAAKLLTPLEEQSWNPPSLRARLERSWPERRPQTRAEVQRQTSPDHAGERRKANSPSSRQWMRKELRRRSLRRRQERLLW